MEFSAFEATLAKNEFSPVYHLTGEENFLIRRALRKIDEAFEKAKGSFGGRETYEAESWGEAMASLYTDSMFGDFKTVVVTEFDKLLTQTSDTDKITRQVQQVIENPPQGTILILVSGKMDKRTKIAKMLASETAEVNCGALKPYQIEKWVQKRVRSFKLRLSQDALSMLVRRIGGTIEDLEHELEKLSLFQPEGPEISEKEVRLLVEDRSEEPIYILYNALDRGDKRWAYETLKDLLNHVDSPIQIVAGLSRHVSELLKFQSLRRQKVPGNEIQKQMGISSFKMRQLSEGAENFDSDRLTRMLRLLESTDERMKTGSRAGEDLLYRLVGID